MHAGLGWGSRGLGLGEHGRRLRHGAREAVEDETVGAVGRLDVVLDDSDDLVRGRVRVLGGHRIVAHVKSPAAKDMATISDRAISVPFIFQFPAAIFRGI